MSSSYTPPEIWSSGTENGGTFAAINRSAAGAREQHDLPVGEHPFQLYSLATPNGQKAGIMFEELLEAGHGGAEYDAWMIAIRKGQQFWSGFVEINPNSKIPALVDRSGPEPVRIFESGAILIHLAEKFDFLLPRANPARAEVLSWLMWHVGTSPFIAGGFGHFYHYAPEKLEYPIDRYAMETKRIFDVADRQLAKTEYLAGPDYSIADIASYTWLSALWHGSYGGADRFLSLHEYENVVRWVTAIDARPAVIRGRLVNSIAMAERHSAGDFDRVRDRSVFEPVRHRLDK